MTEEELNRLADAVADRVVARVFAEVVPWVKDMVDKSKSIVLDVERCFNESAANRPSGKEMAKEICHSFEKQVSEFLEQQLGHMVDLRVERHCDRMTETFLATRGAVQTIIAKRR